jgi:hypothetical protein
MQFVIAYLPDIFFFKSGVINKFTPDFDPMYLTSKKKVLRINRILIAKSLSHRTEIIKLNPYLNLKFL